MAPARISCGLITTDWACGASAAECSSIGSASGASASSAAAAASADFAVAVAAAAVEDGDAAGEDVDVRGAGFGAVLSVVCRTGDSVDLD